MISYHFKYAGAGHSAGAMVRRPVIIGGDAAHAGAPTLAQGATMVIEDTIVLAEELQNHADHETALQAYVLQKKSPTSAQSPELILRNRPP